MRSLLLVALLALTAPRVLAQPALTDRLDAVRQATAVELVLATDEAMEGLEAEVDVRGGVVTLTGAADSAPQRERAGRLASGVPGVREVVNRLSVNGQQMQADLVRPSSGVTPPPRRAEPRPAVTEAAPRAEPPRPSPVAVAAAEADEPESDRDPASEPVSDPEPTAPRPTEQRAVVPSADDVQPARTAGWSAGTETADAEPTGEEAADAVLADAAPDEVVAAGTLTEDPTESPAEAEPTDAPTPDVLADATPAPNRASTADSAPVGAGVDVVGEQRAEIAVLRAEVERLRADNDGVREENDRLRAELAARPSPAPVAAARPAPRRAARPTPPPAPTHHRVASGDNLIALARRYDTTVAELRRLNSITGSNIRIGQRLRVK